MDKINSALEKQRRHEATLNKMRVDTKRRLKRAERGKTFLKVIGWIYIIALTVLGGIAAVFDEIAEFLESVVDPNAMVFSIPVVLGVWLILVIWNRVRIGRLEKEVARLDKELESLHPDKKTNSRQSTTKSYSSSPSSGVKNTDWYKQKEQEHYDRLMGYAPREFKYSEETTNDALQSFVDDLDY